MALYVYIMFSVVPALDGPVGGGVLEVVAVQPVSFRLASWTRCVVDAPVRCHRLGHFELPVGGGSWSVSWKYLA